MAGGDPWAPQIAHFLDCVGPARAPRRLVRAGAGGAGRRARGTPLARQRAARTAVALVTAAAAAVDALGVGAADDVLVLCNDEQRAIADALAEAATGPARRVTVMPFPAATRHGEEPPPAVAAAMAAATVVFAPTTFSVSHTQAQDRGDRRAASGSRRCRASPRRSSGARWRSTTTELKRAGEEAGRSADSAASTCRIAAQGGTDLQLELAGRSGISRRRGPARAVGAFGNLPAGEGSSSRGDRRRGHDRVRRRARRLRPARGAVSVVLSRGRSSRRAARWAPWLLRTLDAGGEHGRSLAELGIGTNPAARLSGNILEDEKVKGTIHIAFGTSATIGGVNVSSVHIDGMVLQPDRGARRQLARSVLSSGRPATAIQDGLAETAGGHPASPPSGVDVRPRQYPSRRRNAPAPTTAAPRPRARTASFASDVTTRIEAGSGSAAEPARDLVVGGVAAPPRRDRDLQRAFAARPLGRPGVEHDGDVLARAGEPAQRLDQPPRRALAVAPPAVGLASRSRCSRRPASASAAGRSAPGHGSSGCSGSVLLPPLVVDLSPRRW